MFTFLAIIHLLASLIMVAFILLQDPKGGGAFGLIGSSGTKSLFGSSGANQFLVNVTKWSAIVFAITSISLATLSAQKNTSVIDQYTPSQNTPKQKVPTQTSPTSPVKEPAPTSPTSPTSPAQNTSNQAVKTTPKPTQKTSPISEQPNSKPINQKTSPSHPPSTK